MKNITLLLFLFFSVQISFAQSGSVSGVVTDAKDRSGIPGAQVLLISLPDSAIRAEITNVEGRFNFAGVADGRYLVRIGLLGFKSFNRTIRVAGQPVALGQIAMVQGITQLKEIEVVGKTPPAIQKGDTSEYNSNAFKTNPDANAEDLVQKMPGVVMQDGKVQAQGEDVKQVLVDGKPFFGDDAAATLRNLPAEIIDKIQVFDQQSEQSQFSGVNDGNTTKTINIVTKPQFRNGTFGKVYAGVGPDKKYQAGGNVNIMKGTRRFSIIGLTNNINQQNFASEDLLGVTASSGQGGRGGRGGRGGGGPGGPGGMGRGGQGGDASDFMVSQRNGIATTHALGINYADQWGKKIEVTSSYFINATDTRANENLIRKFIPTDSGQVYSQNSVSDVLNINHRFNMRLEWKIDSANSIMFRPKLSVQQNEGNSAQVGQTFSFSELLLNNRKLLRTDLLAYNLSSDLMWRHRFVKKGRTFSANLNTATADNSGDRELTDIRVYHGNTFEADSIRQLSDLITTGPSFELDLDYNEPVGKTGTITAEYEVGLTRQAADQETFDFAEATGGYTLFNPGLSNAFNADYWRQEMGAGYRHRTEKVQLMGRLNYQYATLKSEQEYPFQTQINRDFSNVLPMAMMMYNFSKDKNLRLFYRTRTNPPTINQLQNVIDNSNSPLLTTGNPNLKQQYSHMLFMRFSSANPGKLTNFFGMIGGELTDDYIGQSTIINQDSVPLRLPAGEILAGGLSMPTDVILPSGSQLSFPVNFGSFNPFFGSSDINSYRLRSFVNYGFPVGLLKSNINLNGTAVFSRSPGLINGELNLANTQNYGVGFVLSSNISQNVDFTISTSPSYNVVKNTLQTNADNNYYNQTSRVSLNLIGWNGLVLRTELNHQYYSGLSESFNQDFLLWNASIGKKLFKNNQGEIQLVVFDILKQNNSIQRNVTTTYIEDVETNVLQRYFMINFTYNLRSFGKGGTVEPGPEMNPNPNRGHRPEGRF